MGIRYITEQYILDVAASGETEIVLDEETRVTAQAKETAQNLGIRLLPPGQKPSLPQQPASSSESLSPTSSPSMPSTTTETENIHQQIRRAVIARLGQTPEGLDEIIARVLKGLEEKR